MIAASESVGSTIEKLVAGAAVTALFAGLIGGLLSQLWDNGKRRRESDLAARESIYRSYTQFFSTWKLWESYQKHPVSTAVAPADIQWQLLVQAGQAEAGFEALVIKAASEKKLSPEVCERLAAFRQAYQSLRESIRDGTHLEWHAGDFHSDGGEGFRKYRAYKALAGYFATVLVEDRPSLVAAFAPAIGKPKQSEAIRAIVQATASPEDWFVIGELLLPSDVSPAPASASRVVP